MGIMLQILLSERLLGLTVGGKGGGGGCMGGGDGKRTGVVGG